MEIDDTNQTREQYFETQINRSKQKFEFCKVSIQDAIKYHRLIRKYTTHSMAKHLPIFLCLGTRNGREIDLFRVAEKKSLLSWLVCQLEWHRVGFHPLLDNLLFGPGRYSLNKFARGGYFGVEINPIAKRKDVFTGSFDDLPQDWERIVDVIYSNSFDQSQDPHRTAKQWCRIAKKNALLILAINHVQNTSVHDPVGKLSLEDILNLFPGELMYYQNCGSRCGYSEIVIRMQ